MPWNLIIALVMIAVSYALTALTAKGPPPPPSPATIAEFDFPQIDEGTPQTVVFGDVWLEDWMVLWYGDLRSEGIAPPQAGKK